ncbi:GTP diphosphokinase [Litorivivens sp.]|uniref:GTP diphosphokinase n=1 Tax=Litorivivens sp. TaxID=2020868 RepID=UPI0035623302
MVKVREDYPLTPDGEVDLQAWVNRLGVRDEIDTGVLISACELSAECARRSGATHNNTQPMASFFTALEMVEILSNLHLDQDALVAAALYRSVREGRLELDLVQQRYGSVVHKLIDGVQRMAAITVMNASQHDSQILGQSEAQSETIRKMLVALVDDVRVALIKLAERTSAIRAVKNKPEKRYRVAREVFDIYAPLAHRLGIGHIKWELEDLSFRYLQPLAYKKIAKLLDEKRLDRQRYIDEAIAQISSSLEKEDVQAEIVGRAKHIYSIWRKMQRKGIGFSQVYDIRAVRILVPDIKSCYTVLGVIHGLWRNIPNEFDDYIANPKENGYRSLHTAVIGPMGKVLEVQIRTGSMHEEAEFGVCSHWRYKGADGASKNTIGYEEKIAWLRQVLDWHEESGDSLDISDHLQHAQDRVYVFTPDGHVVNLQFGSTPLDFAYHIHTEVGHRCRGAKVNGRIVPLTYTLQTGERVEILTGKENAPRRDWLQSNLGYLKTTRARSKVQHWFRQQAKEDNILAGRYLLEKEFKRLGLTSIDYKTIASGLNCSTVDDMYAAVGSGDLSSMQVIKTAHALLGRETPKQPVLQTVAPSQHDGAGDISISGVGNLLTHIAGCCKPLPGEAIVGYITVGRGVSIHRQDCKKLLHLQAVEPERIVEVSWAGRKTETYPVDIEIEAYDRQGLLRDITFMLSNEHINVISMSTDTDVKSHMASMRLRVEVPGLAELANLFAKLNGLPNVANVRRISEL